MLMYGQLDNSHQFSLRPFNVMTGGFYLFIFFFIWDSHTLIHLTAVNIVFLPIIIKEGAGNSFLQFVGMLHT